MAGQAFTRNRKRGQGRHGRRNGEIRTLIVALIGIVSILLGGGGGVSAALALADSSASAPQYLSITKTVDGAASVSLTAGESFTYQITVKCSEEDCVNATLSDALPADLAGFAITAVSSGSSSGTAVPVSWSGGSQPAVVGADTVVTATPAQSLGGGETGLTQGSTFYVNLTLQVPNDFSPLDSRNGKAIVNTAAAAADNAADVEDQATVTVSVDQKLAVTLDKDWSPSTASYSPASISTITLTATNESNVSLDSLVVQDPRAALSAEGASTLDVNNPFRITNFAGFDSSSTLPEGATAVRVDAYVQQGGTWTWVTGDAGASYALPSGVSNGEVGGLRFTYMGAAIEIGSPASAVINLAQRSTDRNDDAELSTVKSSVANVASAKGSRGAASSPTVQDDATFTVTPLALGTTVAKSFASPRIPAGNSTVATVTARNTDSAVKTFVVSDYNATTPFFTDFVTFDGFTAGVNWPQGATSGTVKYYLLGGGTEQNSFGNGDVPPKPSVDIAGFDLIFTSASDTIETNARVDAKFAVATSSGENFGLATALSSTNTVTSTVTASNGSSDTDDDSATLTRVKPAISVNLTKTVRPTVAVQPGEQSVVSLLSTTSSSSDYLKPTTIVVEDAWGDAENANGYWNAFNLTSIQPTQIPSGVSLTVDVQKRDGTWVTIATVSSSADVQLFNLDSSEFATALTAAEAGLVPSDLVGSRFTFVGSTEFAASATVRPYLGFTARSVLRSDGTTPTNTDSNTPTEYTNTATTTGSGRTEDGTLFSDDDDDTAVAPVIIYPSGVGVAAVSKAWDKDVSGSSVGSQSGAGTSVDAQSQETRVTHLNWRVSSGFQEVVLSDPNSAEATPLQTVFNAFNLKSINAIAASSTSYANGWYLKYDTISSIELYNGSDWVPVDVPTGGWQSSDGSFKGYSLSATEQSTTLGVRITLVPNDTARSAALTSGSGDPYAPEPGSGVAASASDRIFDLTWQLRNTLRVQGTNASTWVTEDTTLNGGTGDVTNSVGLAATPYSGAVVRDNDSDTISIIDQPPGVRVTKNVADNVLIVPAPGTGGTYPTTSYTLKATNDSSTRAQFVRVLEPAICSDTDASACQSANTAAGATGNPFGSFTGSVIDTADVPNPFNRQDITKVTIAASVTSEVDLSKSVVWLLKYDRTATGANKYTVVQTTAAAVNALSASALVDVVGISVTFQGSDPLVTGGTISSSNNLTIKLNTVVRSTLRDTGEDHALTDEVTSNNRVFAQSYDLVTGADVLTGDVSSALITLSGGLIDIVPTKTITDGNVVEPNRAEPQTVKLSANQGTSSAPANRVVLEDRADSEEFWNSVNFAGLSSITAPAGADRVQIDVYGPFGTDGALEWTEGTEQPLDSYSLPVSTGQFEDVQGIRFTFTRADGSVFSASNPNWSAKADFTVQLRETVRGTTTAVQFPGSVTDTLSAQSFGKLDASNVEKATDDLTWTTGTHVLKLNKLANGGVRTAQVGSMIPWDITVANGGTGYLDLDDIVDALPPALLFTGVGPNDSTPAVQFTPDSASGSTLTSAPSVDSAVSGQVSFSWPADENRMQPGESVTIRIWLELQPGLSSGQRATNMVTANTVQNLDSCSDIGTSDGSAGVTFDSAHPTACSTSDYVAPTTGPNLFVVKGVLGSLDGAINPKNPDQACTPTLTVAGTSYYRNPCVANSTIGGTDSWALHLVNAGTTRVTSATIFDQLPTADDRYLVSGSSRGSDYAVALLDSIIVSGPADTTKVLQVTTSPGVCVGTWANLANQDPCEQNGEIWDDADASTDWSAVTGIRVILNFADTADGALIPGQQVDVTYSTRNAPATTANPDGASIDVPATDEYAWNQFGVKYKDASQVAYSKIAPNAVGVHLRTGSISVTKALSGGATEFAPSTITATSTCSVDGVDLTFDGEASKALTLTKASGGSYAPVRVTGIPVGSDCYVAEDGSVGAFGETSRSVSATKVTVQSPDGYAASDTLEAGTPSNDVPVAQAFGLLNEYDWSGLSITKTVDTTATSGDFGPFTFTLSCVTSSGTNVPLDAGDSSFVIGAGETHVVTGNTIPVGATCTVAEVNSSANAIAYTGDNVSDNGDGTATVVPGSSAAAVNIVNKYDAGTFTVAKVVDGAGANAYGNGPFTFSATCVYMSQTLLDVTFTLDAGQSKTFGVYPAGTRCTTAETDSAGATSTSVSPQGGVVDIVAAQTKSAVVTYTNTFDLGSISATKTIAGKYGSYMSDFDFAFTVVCTFQGTEVLDETFSLSGGESRKFSAIPVGSECSITETDSLHADSVEYSVADGKITLTEAKPQVTVGVTNNYDTPESVTANGIYPPGYGPLVNSSAGGYLTAGVALGVSGIVAGLLALYFGLRRPRRQH